MTNTRKALEMAIEALEDAQKSLDGQFSCGNCYTDEIQACKEALEQPAQDDTEFWEKLQSEVDENGY